MEVCPICLERKKKLRVLKCSHKIHDACAKGLNTMTCPICRKPLKGLPLAVRKKIQKNISKKEKDAEEEELSQLEIERILSEEILEELSPASILLLAVLFLAGQENID